MATKEWCYRNKRRNIKINSHPMRNNWVGMYEDKAIFVDDIELIFNKFGGDREHLKAFLNNEFAYVRPNADMVKFDFDPRTGEEIDWKEITNAILDDKELSAEAKDFITMAFFARLTKEEIKELDTYSLEHFMIENGISGFRTYKILLEAVNNLK